MASNVPPFERALVNLLQKRFFNTLPPTKNPIKSPTTPKTNTKTEISNKTPQKITSFTVKYLVKSCGLSLDSAISASKKVVLDEKKKKQFDSVVSFLQSHNFSNTDIIRLVKIHPTVLTCKIPSTLEPKFQFFADNGIIGSNLPKAVVASPAVLFRSLETQLKPAMNMIKGLLSCPDKISVVIQRGSWLFTSDLKKLQRNLDYLIELGLHKREIEKLVVRQPRCLFQDISRIKYAVEMIKTMGVELSDNKFIRTLCVMLSLSELTWKRKVEIFKSLGWSSEEVISTFINNPHCFSCSEENLRKSMDYFVNTANIDRETIIGYPKVLMYSLEKRVKPRYIVWKILDERKLIKDMQFIWVLNHTEKVFIEKFVAKYSDEIPNLLHIYMSAMEDSIISV